MTNFLLPYPVETGGLSSLSHWLKSGSCKWAWFIRRVVRLRNQNWSLALGSFPLVRLLGASCKPVMNWGTWSSPFGVTKWNVWDDSLRVETLIQVAARYCCKAFVSSSDKDRLSLKLKTNYKQTNEEKGNQEKHKQSSHLSCHLSLNHSVDQSLSYTLYTVQLLIHWLIYSLLH